MNSSLFALLCFTAGFNSGRSDEKIRFQNPRDVVIVAARAIPAEDADRVAELTVQHEQIEEAKLGKWTRLVKEGRVFAVADELLLESRYTLSEKALVRLVDLWRPGSPIKLSGEETLRLWLSAASPANKNGKDANDAAVFNLLVGARLTFEYNGRKIVTFLPPVDPFEGLTEASWPMPPTKSPPKAGDDQFTAGLPPSLTIFTRRRYDPEEYLERVRLTHLVIDEWHRERFARLRSKAAKFFQRADDALASEFGGSLPVGRSVSSLQTRLREAVKDDIASQFRTFRFTSAGEASKWVDQSKIIDAKSILFAAMPRYVKGQRSSSVFIISLP